MKTRETTVTDSDGNVVRAEVIVCPDCGNESFNIFFVGERHEHLQCTQCRASFCDGSCGEVRK